MDLTNLIILQAKGGKKLDAADDVDEVATNIVITNGVSKEKTPENGSNLTYEEELCLRLEEEARLGTSQSFFCFEERKIK